MSKLDVSLVAESLYLQINQQKIKLHEDKELKFHGLSTQFCIY
jgi:hypothetical protein